MQILWLFELSRFADFGTIAAESVNQLFGGHYYSRSMQLHKEALDALAQIKVEVTKYQTQLFR